METKHPTLRRPKRKLCYPTNKQSSSKQWSGTMTLGDVDMMFDDLDSSSQDLFSPSPSLHTSDTETKQSKRDASSVPQEARLTKKLPTCQMGLDGDVLHPSTKSPSPNLDTDVDTLFDMHGPVNTSSPIEDKVVIKDIEEESNEKKQVEPPVLFDCDDLVKEDTKTQPPTIQKLNGHIPEKIDDPEWESPPSKITFSKAIMSTRKNKVEISWQETPDPPHSAVIQVSERVAPEKDSRSVRSQPLAETSTSVGKDMTAFLRKLRHPKPASLRKSLSPVQVPSPPDPEDDFLILEDDAPLWFSIPSKTATSKRQRQNRTSSTDKDSSTNKGMEDNPMETAQKEEESEKPNAKLQPVDQKIKKKKGKEKNEVTGPGNDADELSIPQDPPADDLVEREISYKKTQQRAKKIQSKESDKEMEEPKAAANRKPEEKKPSQKVEKEAQKSYEMKSSKFSKDGKTSRVKSLKRKVMQGYESIKETVYDETEKEQSQKQNNKKQADVGDVGSPSDEEIMNSDAQTSKYLADEKAKHLPLLTMSEECQILGKRTRKQTGQWWLSCPQSTEETKVVDNRPTAQKSKQRNKEPSTTKTSPMKDKVLKKRNQKHPAPSSSQNRTRPKEKRPKHNKNRPKRGDTKDEMKSKDESKQNEEQQQQEVMDQDLDHVQSSPLVLTHRDLSLNSGDQLFQRVYHPVSNGNISSTPVPVSPRRPLVQLRAAESEKWRRKSGNQWTDDGKSEDMESISSQPQQLNPKLRKSSKDRKKQAKQSRCAGLGTPQNGNMALSSKPLGGAHVPPLKLKPLPTPKTVKHSLAMFKNIFTSSAETPMVVRNSDTSQNDGDNVLPAEEVTVTDCETLSKTDKDVVSMDACEFRSTQNIAITYDKCQHDNTLQDLRSGPSSMIELNPIAENDIILSSPRVPAALSISDLCAPPLKPLTLQPKDKANLTEWFKSLWSTTVNNGAEITPDQFDWYFYQGRAIGVLVDLNCGSICNGKILLGSYMKKPLWVDHSATTVFNLLTSSVNVTIDGSQSHFNPGQSFMVQCGHAYSIQNVTAQPAVLYFTRISAESSD